MSNQDRELIELAAKAAGMKGRWIDYDQTKWLNRSGFYLEPHILWNPLTDDGYAFRLALKLSMSLMSNIVRYEASTIQLTLAGIFIRECTLTQPEDVAARRAIVSAAAEIGKAMP